MVKDPNSNMTEADVTIEGVSLSFGQSMTLRVALSSFIEIMSEPDALGEDEHGKKMAEAYKHNCLHMLRLIARGTN